VKRTKSRKRKDASGARTTGRSLRFSRIEWVTGGLLALIVLGVWLWKQAPSAIVPQVELTNLDASVSKLIQTHLAEVRARRRSASAWGDLGTVLWNYNFSGAARQCLAQAGRLDPREARWPYFLSLSLNTEAPVQAVAHLRRAVQLCGNEPEAPRLRLASLLAEDGKWVDAEREIRELLRAKPDFTPARLLEARQLQSRGNFSEAIDLAQRCIDDPRTGRSAAILLAGLYARQGDTAKANDLTRRLATLAPDEAVADPYQAAAAILRSDPRVLTEQTHPLLAAGRLKEAEPLVQRLLKEHSEYAETWLLAGRLQLLRKDLTAAERSLKRCIERDPQSNQGWFQLGLVQLAQGQFSIAAETFLKATRLKADFGPAYYNRGFALARAGDLGGAVPAFHEAIRLNPERIDSYLMAADIALRLKDNREAAKLLQLAEALNADHPGLRQLQEKAGRVNNAKAGSEKKPN